MKKSLIAIMAMLLLVAPADAKKKDKSTLVKIYTTEGNITVKLYDDTPQHKENFLQLVRAGKYEGLLFHRVIKNFMIQGGDPESKDAPRDKQLGAGDLGYTLPAEIKFPECYHKYGALAAARTGDQVNPEKRSSASQFYIVTGRQMSEDELQGLEKALTRCLALKEPFVYSNEQRMQYKTFGGTPHLDGAYTVFGEVVKGFDVLEKIQNKATDANDRPEEDVKILKMKITRR